MRLVANGASRFLRKWLPKHGRCSDMLDADPTSTLLLALVSLGIGVCACSERGLKSWR